MKKKTFFERFDTILSDQHEKLKRQKSLKKKHEYHWIWKPIVENPLFNVELYMPWRMGEDIGKIWLAKHKKKLRKEKLKK